MKRGVRSLGPLLIAGGLGLGACNSTPPEVKEPKAAHIAGHWLIKSVNDKVPPAGQHEISLSINGGSILARSQCVWWVWDYRRDAKGGFSTHMSNWLYREPGGEPTPRPICARGLSHAEKEFEGAVSGATLATIHGSNELHLSGPKDKMAFTHRPGFEGEWEVTALNGRALGKDDYPIEVFIQKDQISAGSQCVGWKWTYSVANGGLRIKSANDFPNCERSRSEAENLFERLVTDATGWTQEDNGDLRIQSGQDSILLEPQP